METKPLKKRGRPVGSKSGVNFVGRHFRVPKFLIDEIKAAEGELSLFCRAAIDGLVFGQPSKSGDTIRIHVMITPDHDRWLESNAELYGTKSRALAALIAGHLGK